MLWGWKPERVYLVLYLDTDSRLLVLIVIPRSLASRTNFILKTTATSLSALAMLLCTMLYAALFYGQVPYSEMLVLALRQ